MPSALVGCSRTENPATKMSHQVHQWVPDGTPLVAARQIMEQHQFTCTIDSYTNQAAMYDSAKGQWKDIVFDYWNSTVTNISILKFHMTNSTELNGKYSVTLRAINGRIDGPMTVVSGW